MTLTSTATCRCPGRRKGDHRRAGTSSRPATSSRPGLPTSGPPMPDGAVIGVDRTAVPVEWGRSQGPIDAAGNGSGPSSQVPTTSVGRFIDSAQCAGRQRRQARQRWISCRCRTDPCRRQRQHRRDRQEPADLRHCPARQQHPDRAVPEPARPLSSVVDDSKVESRWRAEGHCPRVPSGDVYRFIAESQSDCEPDPAAGQRHAEPGGPPEGPRTGTATCRRPRSRNSTTLQSGHRPRVGAFTFANFQNPGDVIWLDDRRRREHHRPRTAKPVRRLSRPGVAAS